MAGVRVRVTGDAGTIDVATDASGLFRVPLHEGLPLGRHGRVTIATGDGPATAEIVVDTRHVARGLRELPPRVRAPGSRRAPGAFAAGRSPATRAPPTGPTTRVPGHVIYDGLVPEDGVATFQRTVDLPATWAGRAVFLRCDGAYGRAEVVVNGTLAGVHGSGATSFDVELTPFLRPGANDLAITLTEYTPYAVLDDMSWYAHMSLLGIWRDILLFSVPPLHLGQLDLDGGLGPRRGNRVAGDRGGRDQPRPRGPTLRARGDDPGRPGRGRLARHCERVGRRGGRARGRGSRPDPSRCARGRPRSPCSTTSRSSSPGTRASRRRIGGGSGSGGWRPAATGSSSTARRSASAASTATTRGSSRAARCPPTTCARTSSTCGGRTST